MRNYELTPALEVKKRVNDLQDSLRKKEIDGALLTKNIDIFYFSGTMQNSMMFIPNEGEPILFVKKSLERAKEETPFIVQEMKSLKQLPEMIAKTGYQAKTIGAELDVLPVNQFERIKRVFSDSSIKDISFMIRLQRSIKSDYEIGLLRKSAEVVKDAVLELPNIIKPGMSELELTSILEKFVRDRGHLGYIRTRAYNMELVLGMVASGGSAAFATSFDGPAGGEGLTPAMPQGSGWKAIEGNEPILVDIAAAVNGYIIDQTRMGVIGHLDEEFERAYQVSLNIIKETEKNAKPGTLWSEHYLHALKIVEEEGLKDHFMGYKENQAKFLGHGVGLELDELPVLAKGLDFPLEEGMVIAIEPKFTFPNKGVIGIENTYVVRNKGLERLSIAPEEIVRI